MLVGTSFQNRHQGFITGVAFTTPKAPPETAANQKSEQDSHNQNGVRATSAAVWTVNDHEYLNGRESGGLMRGVGRGVDDHIGTPDYKRKWPRCVYF